MRKWKAAALAALICGAGWSCVTQRTEIRYEKSVPVVRAIALKLLSIEAEFAERRAALRAEAAGKDGYPRGELLELLAGTGDRVVGEIDGLGFLALADHFREFFDGLPARLDRPASPSAGGAQLASTVPARDLRLRFARLRNARLVARPQAEPVLELVSSELAHVRKQAEQDDLVLDLLVQSRPTGMLVRMYPRFRYPEGKLDRLTDGMLEGVRRGTFVYQLLDPQGQTVDCLELDSRGVPGVCAPFSLVRAGRPSLLCELLPAGWYCRVEERGTLEPAAGEG